MGYFYDTGFNVAGDPKAAEWYQKAPKQDDRVAAWLPGRRYYTAALPCDLDAAETWFGRAASQGDPFGAYLLRPLKLERNDYIAAAMSRKPAMLGIPLAQQQLGELLRDGKGLDADKAQAYTWLMVSYDTGNHTAGTVTRAVVARGCTGWPGEFGTVPTPPPPEIQRFCR